MTRIRLVLIFLASMLVTLAVATSHHDDENELVPLFSHEPNYLEYKYEFYGPYIGIVLGDRHFRVGFENNGRLEFIPNEFGNTKTPNWISFANDRTILIGEAVKIQANLDPQATIFDIKTLLGRKFYHPELQREEIIAMFLRKIKDMAENHLRKRVRKAIITVPDYIVDYQGESLNAVALKAGFHHAKVISPPLATLLAHNIHSRQRQKSTYSEERQNVTLVFHLSDNVCEVNIQAKYMYRYRDVGFFRLAQSVDIDLGGKEFGRRVVNYYVGVIKNKYNKDVLENKTILDRLVKECERAEIELSSHGQVVLEIESLFEGVNFTETLTRTKFEELNADLFEKAMALVESALAKAELKRDDINHVFLLGESSRNPKVQKLFKGLFDGKQLNKADSVNPDEVLLKGALLFPQYWRDINLEASFLQVVPLSFGIQTVGGLMTKVVRRMSLMPVTTKEIFTTNRDNQSTVEIKVFIGEKRFANDCLEIGRFNLSGIVPSPRGVPRIEVGFRVDYGGMIYVNAVDKVSNISASSNMSERMQGYLYSSRSNVNIERLVEESVEEEDKMWWLEKNTIAFL